MSIASEITRINGNIAAAYSSCGAKGATMPVAQNSANLADTIDSISGGAEPAEEKDVNFFDYDGTLLYSYTKAESDALTALPALPSHEGLVCQGWNYSLAEIRNEPDRVNVGCHYTTSDSLTKLYLSAAVGAPIKPFDLYLRIAAQSSVTVEWGDGTSSELQNEDYLPQVKHISHSYSAPRSDTEFCIGISGGHFEIGGATQNNLFGGQLIPLDRVCLGTNCTAIAAYAFQNCGSLSTVSVPNSITGIGINAFQNCCNLKSFSIPSSITGLGNYTFQNCFGLKSVAIPSSITGLGSYTFQYCYSLKSVTIPSEITSIGANMFYQCQTMHSAVLSDGILSVSANMFDSCRNMRTVRLSSVMTSLSSNMFVGCKLLPLVVVPSNVRSIGSMAFYNCESLTVVDLSAFTDPAQIPTLQADAVSSVFYNVPALFYVANAEMLSAFTAATNWSSLPSSRFAVKEANA